MWGDIGFFGWVEKEGRVVVGANGFFDFQKNTCAPSCGGGRTPLAVPPGQTDSLREGSHCRLAATGASTRAQLHAYPGGGSLRGLPPSVNPSGNNIHTHTHTPRGTNLTWRISDPHHPTQGEGLSPRVECTHVVWLCRLRH